MEKLLIVIALACLPGDRLIDLSSSPAELGRWISLCPSNDWTNRFPGIVEAALRNRNSSFVLDGEAVLLDAEGVSTSFDGHQINLRARRNGGDHWVTLMPDVFDALLQFHAKTVEMMKRGAAQCGREDRIRRAALHPPVPILADLNFGLISPPRWRHLVQEKLRLDLREPRVVSPAVSIDLDDVSSGNSGNRSARRARHLAHLALTWGQCTLGQLRLTVVGDFMPVRRRFPEGRFAIRISMRPLREAAPVTPQPSDRGCPYRSRACSWRDMKAAATAALHAPERNTRRKKRYGAELPYPFKAGEFSRQYVSQCRTAAAGSIAGSRPRRGSIRRFAV